MSKIKMRCIACGKWFQSANAKEVTCPDCTQKARKEKLASKNAPPTVSKPASPARQEPGTGAAARPSNVPPKPKPAQGGTSHWLDTLSDVKVGQPDQPVVRPKIPSPPAPRDTRGGPGGYREERGPGAPPAGPGGYREREYDRGGRGPGGYREREIGNRGPGGYREREGGNRGPGGYRPRQPMEGGPGRAPYADRGPRPGGPKEGAAGPRKPKVKSARPAAPPKPKREKIPPPEPFKPTEEQVAQVENRYLELANPTEFDGIRTQIAHELSIPKKAVKKIIKELRDRQNIPSWWEIQTYKGSSEELEQIKTAYEPLLPVPPVGVHKIIAEQLSLKPGTVYQAIKAIRLEMNLPQYNDPTLHEAEEKSPELAKEPATETAHDETESAPSLTTEETTPEVASENKAEEVTIAASASSSENTAEAGNE